MSDFLVILLKSRQISVNADNYHNVENIQNNPVVQLLWQHWLLLVQL